LQFQDSVSTLTPMSTTEKIDQIAAPAKRIYTISDLTREISGLLESQFPLVWVEGEISNFRAPSSGHFYFSLKDANAQIRAVMFRYQNEVLTFAPKDGQQVVGLGRITVYAPRGEYQIVLETLEPKGHGALQQAFEELKRRLAAEGLFDQERKKPLPYLPRRVVVVTSPTGAAIHDFLQVLYRRYPNIETLVYPVRVQGSEAGAEIAAALDHVNREVVADVIVLTRGGGSLEDLWPFNTEVVARAIYRSEIPVISAVGHEIDFTIADFVADRRALTPSAAAETLVPVKRDLETTVQALQASLRRKISGVIELNGERLRGAKRSLKDPKRYLEDMTLKIEDLSSLLKFHWTTWRSERANRVRSMRENLQGRALLQRLETLKSEVKGCRSGLFWSIRQTLEQKRNNFVHARKGLTSVDPMAPLKRGYSVARTLPGHEVIRKYDDVDVGDQVQVLLGSGHILCEIFETRQDTAPLIRPDKERS